MYVLPGTDFALLPDSEVTLRFFDDILFTGATSTSWVELNTLSNFQLSTDLGSSVVTLSGTTLVAVAAGITVGTVDLTYDEVISGVHTLGSGTAMIRVRVFDECSALYSHPGALSLEEQRSDRILTIFATMKRGTVSKLCDVTSHPFLQYSSDDPALVSVDAFGRVSTGTTTGLGGFATITISIGAESGPALPITVQVNVSARVTDRPIVTKLTSSASSSPTRFLFLAEGFTNSIEDKARFDTTVNDVKEELLNTSPYKLVADSIEVYSAFTPSQEAGLTIGTPLGPGYIRDQGPTAELAQLFPGRVKPVGDEYSFTELIERIGYTYQGSPENKADAETEFQNKLPNTSKVTDRNINLWHNYGTIVGFARNCETRFGLIQGGRLSSPLAMSGAGLASANEQEAHFTLVPRYEQRTITVDDRRLPDLANGPPLPIQSLDDFVTTLRTLDGELGEGARWATGGVDHGFVCILVNHDVFCATNLRQALFVAVGHGDSVRVIDEPIDGLRAFSPVWMHVGEADDAIATEVEPLKLTGYNKYVVADIVAHEFGHSFGLKDEYGGMGDVADAAAVAAELQGIPNVRPDDILINGTGPGIDTFQLPWMGQTRALQATRIVSIRLDSGNVIVEVPPSVAHDPRRPVWAGLVGSGVELRARRRLGVPPSLELTIIGFSTSTRELVLVPDPADNISNFPTRFGTDSAVLLTIQSSTGPTNSILPAIRTELEASGVLFKPADDPAFVDCAHVAPYDAQHPKSGIVGVAYPVDDTKLVGAYVGGHVYDCGTLRPAGACKMRFNMATDGQVAIDFCYVCKYVIVETIDVSSLGVLDEEYPQ